MKNRTIYTVQLYIWLLAILLLLILSACTNPLPPENQCPEPLTNTLCIAYPVPTVTTGG